MPATRYISLNIASREVELPNVEETDLGFKLSYILEEPENFMSKAGADPQNITIPASKNNDQIFNTFYNPQVEDLTPDSNAIKSSTLTTGGTLWTVNDIFEVLGFGTVPATAIVLSISGSAVATYAFLSLGNGYPTGVATCNALGASTGTGLTINITAVYATSSPREYMPCVLSVNGSTPVLNGYALLTDASFTDKPESYDVTLYGSSGQWVIDMQTITMWDCVNPNSHAFTVAEVIATWGTFDSAGDGSDDFVYAPVRYRQPFDGTTLGYQGDNCVNIYHLRPSISLYWLMQRAFNQIGYTIKSQFMTTAYFHNLVLPWVWGDFYDLNSQLIQGITFKAVGQLPSPTEPPPINGLDSIYPYGPVPFWSGANSANASLLGSAGGSSWWRAAGRSGSGAVGGYDPAAFVPATNPQASSVYNRTTSAYVSYNGVKDAVASGQGLYVFNGNGNSGSGWDHYVIDINTPPNGYDNFGLYSFDATTGTMKYFFNPLASLAGVMANLTATFIISQYMTVALTGTGQVTVALEVVHIPTAGDTLAYNFSINPLGGAWVGTTNYPGSDSRYPITPTNCNFNIPNLNPGDHLTFRMRIVDDGTQTASYGFFSGGYLNNNPAVIGVPSYTYNPITQSYQFFTPNAIWSPLQSNLNMTGFLIQLGDNVNLKNYDAFRNYQMLDLLGGVFDIFNMELSTDAVNQVVYIEPMFGGTLPNSETYDGYFHTLASQGLFDWSGKRDYTKASKVTLFNGIERQVDLGFKLDGSDGAQNIWAQRYKNIYLGNRTYTGGIYQGSTGVDHGIIAGVPGCARYMFPNRMAVGNRQMTNRFFSAVMHVPFPQWEGIGAPDNPAPQLITIFSDSSNSSGAISQTFTPKLAFYGGYRPQADAGGWIFIGDPAFPNADPMGFELPFMAAVNYGSGGTSDPCLSYSDELNGTAVMSGLLSQFYRHRFAIMRNGQLLLSNIRLNLNDVTNWVHKECIMIDGTLYALIQIDGYDPLQDNSTPCTFWKVVLPEEVDVANSYPSKASIVNYRSLTSLPNSFDLRYAPLLLYPTDTPQIG